MIRPGEFDEFGVSFRVPETPGESLLFPSLQTYSNGEVVRWVDPDPEGETPAPQVAVLPPAEEEEAAAGETTTEEAAGTGETGTEEIGAAPAAAAEEDDSTATVAIILAIAGLVAGLIALAVALFRKPRASA